MGDNKVIQNKTNLYSLGHIICPFFILLLILTSFGCVSKLDQSLLKPTIAPYFLDDCDKESLISAANHHLNFLRSKKAASGLRIQGQYYSNRNLQESLALFIEILKTSATTWEMSRRIRKNFNFFQAAGREGIAGRQMLVTGYFEPVLEGSLTRDDTFHYPLYAVPDSLIIRKSPKNNKNIIGRFDQNNNFVPYWSREDIEEMRVAHGFELVYLRDPLDAFLVHVQGSGTIALTTGELRKIRYAVSNGREYSSIGKLLVDRGKISLKEASIPTIRAYLQKHPDEQQQIFNHNKRFIFFQWEKGGDVIGSLGRPLTPGRSIAIDQQKLPAELLCFLVTRKPVVDRQRNITSWQKMSRFVLPQDSGSAIKGSGRVDVFWGNGGYAQIAAGCMKEKGQLFFFVKKHSKKQRQFTQ